MKRWTDGNLEKWLNSLPRMSNFKKWGYSKYLDKHYVGIKKYIGEWMELPRENDFPVSILFRDIVYTIIKNHRPFITHLELKEYPDLLDSKKLFEEVMKVGDVVHGAIRDEL